MVIPLTGWAADRFGTKRLYMTALLLFTLGSVLCATASSIGMLIGFRFLQGLGGGMLMPLGMTIMTRAAGPARMGRLMAILGVPMLLGPIFGPILGGYLIDNYSWHWIFLINVPIGAAAIIYAWLRAGVRPPHPVGVLRLGRRGPDVPRPGAVPLRRLLDPRRGHLLLAQGHHPRHPRPAHDRGLRVLELQAEAPAARPAAVPATATSRSRSSRCALFAAAFFGGLLLVPTYFQQVRGETPLQAGWLMAVQGLGAMITMPIAGALTDKLPVGRIVPFGLVAIIGGMFALTQLTATTPYSYILPVLFVMGLGMGATMMPLMTSALKTLKSHDVARGSTLLNISQQVASSIGVAIMSVVLTNGLKNDPLLAASTAFNEATAGVKDPAQLGAIAAQFPEVAALLAKGQEVLMAAIHEAMAVRVRQHLLGGRDPACPHADPGVLPAAQARGVAPARRRVRRRRRLARSLLPLRRASTATLDRMPVPHLRGRHPSCWGRAARTPRRDHRRRRRARRPHHP